MFSLLKKFLPDAGSASTETEDLKTLVGYSPEAAREAARELTEQKTKILQLGRDIKRNGGGKPDSELENAITQVANFIGKVAQNLRQDSSDLARLNLAQFALKPLIELMERFSKQVSLGNTDLASKSRIATISALNEVTSKFKQLSEGTLQIDDNVMLKALEQTVKDLCNS